MSFTNTVDSVGDAALTDSIIDKSITELADEYILTVGQQAFRSCTSLTKVEFVNVSKVDTAGFYSCTALEKADFHSFVAFGTNAFYGCTALAALILRSADQVCTCNSSFSSSAIASGTGYIYVPSALVDSYKASSGWSDYAAQIRAIEDYPEVCDPYTWPAVFKAIDNGTYASVYSVGDLVELDLGSEGVVNMQIAGFDVDDLADGSGKAPISWISKELLMSHRMNPKLVTNEDGTYQEGTGSIGGWEKCEMRTYLQETVKPLIPETVRNRIASVTKTQPAYDTSNSSFTQTTRDEVWIPSYDEIFSSSGMHYSSFSDKSIRIKCLGKGSVAFDWWLRSAKAIGSFYYVSSAGSYSTGGNNLSLCIALGFCT